MTNNDKDIKAQGMADYDSRQIYVAEIVGRLHLYLDCSRGNLLNRLDTLFDFFVTCCPWITKGTLRDGFLTRLHDIDEIVSNRQAASKETTILNKKTSVDLDIIAIDILDIIRDRGLLIPESTRKNPNRAFAGYHE